MKRRRFQICDSEFRVLEMLNSFVVEETWQEIDRHGLKVDEFVLHGPFNTRHEAQCELAGLADLNGDV